MESALEAAIGMSRKWDAWEAGREVAETAIKDLSRPPDFFLFEIPLNLFWSFRFHIDYNQHKHYNYLKPPFSYN